MCGVAEELQVCDAFYRASLMLLLHITVALFCISCSSGKLTGVQFRGTGTFGLARHGEGSRPRDPYAAEPSLPAPEI